MSPRAATGVGITLAVVAFGLIGCSGNTTIVPERSTSSSTDPGTTSGNPNDSQSSNVLSMSATGGPGTSSPTGEDTTTSTRVCGDDTVDDAEACDGSDLADADCEVLGFSGGTLACASDCTFDVSGCFA